MKGFCTIVMVLLMILSVLLPSTARETGVLSISPPGTVASWDTASDVMPCSSEQPSIAKATPFSSWLPDSVLTSRIAQATSAPPYSLPDLCRQAYAPYNFYATRRYSSMTTITYAL